MKTSNIILVFIISIFMVSCKVAPSKIDYGKEACHYCKMTIVDKQHAAELVSKKRKAFKFDSTECMLNYLKNEDSSKYSLFLTNTFDAPNQMVNAKEAFYLKSKAIQSPMGADLTAFKTKILAEKTKQEKGGEIYTWTQLKTQFKK